MNWITKDVPLELHPEKNQIIYFSRSFNFHPLLIQYLYSHGIKGFEGLYDFFYPSYGNLHNPFLLKDMKKAVDRIHNAINNQERILVYGDYDADGITSTSILFKCLKKFGANAHYRLPTRADGYGITPEAVKKAAEKNTALIITVDNGSAAHDAMDEAARRGIDVIVTDHHLILGKHPKCFAFINPKREDELYPFTDLCGAGVAFKLVHSLYLATNKNWSRDIQEYIELVTLGTICDLMPLAGENRILCSLGLRKMNSSPSPVFREIFNQLKVSRVNSGTIGYQLGPIFNALGRIDDPNVAVEVLVSESIDEESIKQLIELNNKRKFLTQVQFEDCDGIIHKNSLHNNNVIIVHGDFHHGIIGILASKIQEKYKKPAIVISQNGTGSCRGVNGTDFSIINTLERCKKHFKKYGGHQAAAGFSIVPNETVLEEFHKDIQMSAMKEGTINPVKHYFTTLTPQMFSEHLYQDFQILEPFGNGFTQPIFLSDELFIHEVQTFGNNNLHAKCIVPNGESFYLFNKGELASKLKGMNFKFFYSSTLSQRNEFIIHGINRI
ncbi:single-stranded-DNA-specific exonuclease RecJ [Bacillus salipaludis]|uniref:Single-stranded-DNA-specific exonuclease RecJ n=1 Tax=Bacillus salipaludis TaxID=2547811 RepID=A0A4R5VT31_9BACI|nr:single-stranded-DNA-specific exonuclease RecJ [Bacillus salipaludis]TDK61757.1 single-stranded-DNA-specific exonuclease RecJ [Bacillus salipaludis]